MKNTVRIEFEGVEARYTVYDSQGAIVIITKFRYLAEKAIKTGMI